MDERPSRLPLYVGLGLVAAGWAVLYLGWQRAGQQELETGQLPFLLSGGFGGWGLMLLGVAAVIIDVLLQASWRQRRASQALAERMDELVELFRDHLTAAEDVEEEEPAPGRRTKKGRPSRGRSSA